MSSNIPNSICIRPVPDEDRSAAFDLALSHLTAEERSGQIEAFSSASAADERFQARLLGAYKDGRLAGTVISQIQPGKIAQVWLPGLIENEQSCTAITLLRAVSEQLDQSSIHMAQILLETVTAEDEQLLIAGAFGYLTDLFYLACPEDVFSLAPLSTSLEFESYTLQNHDRLAKIVDATYQETLDCPKLNHVRQLDDVLDGYRGTGQFTPSNWFIVRFENQDVGCLLLADHPRYENMELVYMGIIPSRRGRCWGADVARFAQGVARRVGRKRMVLAVDASNSPAIKMYVSVGFRVWDQRRVYYRIFSR